MGKEPFNSRRNRQLALAASIALNGAVLLSVSQTRWATSAALPVPDTVVVWLADRPIPAARSIEDDPAEPTDVDVDPFPDLDPLPDVELRPVPEDEPELEPEPTAPAETTERPNPSRLPPPEERVPSRSPIDWEAVKMRAVVRMREENARADAYLTFSYPEASQEPSRSTDTDSVTIAGIQIRPRGPCVRSVGSFLARLFMPIDVCQRKTAARDSYLTRDQRDRIASVTAGLEEYRSR